RGGRVPERVEPVVGVQVVGPGAHAGPLVPAGQGHGRRSGLGRRGRRDLLEDGRHDKGGERVVGQAAGPGRGRHRGPDAVVGAPTEVAGHAGGAGGEGLGAGRVVQRTGQEVGGGDRQRDSGGERGGQDAAA